MKEKVNNPTPTAIVRHRYKVEGNKRVMIMDAGNINICNLKSATSIHLHTHECDLRIQAGEEVEK